jgi:hypothetical protein
MTTPALRFMGTAASAPVEGCEEALSFAVEEELDDFRARTPRQHMVKLLEHGADNVSSRGFGIAGVTQKVNDAVDPLGIAGVEAGCNGSNPVRGPGSPGSG